MKRLILLLAVAGLAGCAAEVSSPDGRITMTPGDGCCIVNYEGQPVLVLQIPVTSKDLERAWSKKVLMKDKYRMISGKRRECQYEAHGYKFGPLELRLHNDGIAFRYVEPLEGAEPSAYVIPEGTKRWMQQWTDSYEGFFPMTTTAKVPPVPSYGPVSLSPEGYSNHWGYPLLVEPVDGIFTLITEANMEKGQSASSLYNDGEVFRVVPDKTNEGHVPDHTPWRVVIIGSLEDVVESTLVTDLCEFCKLDDTDWIHPGVVLLLVGILLAQLVQMQLCRLQGSFCLPHTVAGAGAEAVQVELVAELGFQSGQLHLLHLYLHLAVGELRLGIGFQLRHLLTLDLEFVESLGIVRLCRLQV